MSSSSPASPSANSCRSGKNEPEQTPRPPHDITLSRIANGNPENQNHCPQNSNDSADGGSNLSAAAKVFVPKSAKEATESSYVPSLKRKSELSPSAKEFVPRNNEDMSNKYSSFAHLSLCPARLSSSNSYKKNPVDAFKTAIYHLTTHPGNLDDYIKPVADILLETTDIDDDLLCEIVDLLVNESITVSNFRYTGARICKYFNQLDRINNDFRHVLLKRCEEEYSRREELISDENTIPRLCGFSLFLAELFLLLEIETEDFTVKYAVLRNALHSLLELLLENSSNQTVKCATQLMKLAGATIEDTHFLDKEEQQSFSDIYTKLNELKESPELNQTCHLLIKSVLDLKAKNFDRVEPAAQSNISASPIAPAPAPELPAAAAATDLTSEPVFFNEIGQQISRVEAGYSVEDDLALICEADLVENDQLEDVCNDYGDDQGYVENAGVMDDEMMRCYEEFLRDTEK